jgi:hypothetical protein
MAPSIATPSRPPRERLFRYIVLAFTMVLSAAAIVEAIVLLWIIDQDPGWSLGMDHAFYVDVGRRWLGTGSFYNLHQLVGGYDVSLMVDVLYPPLALALFVPFTVLPSLLWWGIPIGVLALGWRRWKPDYRAWPVVLGLIMWPRSMAAFFYGNTDMWVTAGIAGGLLAGWPAMLVLLKPTLVPFVFAGAWRRGWWIVPAALLVSIVVAFPLWEDYITAIRNLRIGWEYSLGSLPLAFLPLVMWVSRTRSSDADPASGSHTD